jgi:hypothetical protein
LSKKKNLQPNFLIPLLRADGREKERQGNLLRLKDLKVGIFNKKMRSLKKIRGGCSLGIYYDGNK